jgi:NAD(P)H dehydrogenase (quinone)
MSPVSRRGTDEAEQKLGEPGPAVRVAVAYHSVRGHVAKLAHAVAEGVDQVPAATVDLVALDVLTDTSWTLFDRADALIFGCPTFMGGVSAVFKAFAEASLRPWIDNLRWRNKVAGGFTHSQAMSGDKLHTLQYFTILAAQHGMIWVPLDLYAGWCSSAGAITDLNRLGAWLGATSQSDRDAPLEIAPNARDLETARHLGRRVAQVTCQVLTGRRVLGGAVEEHR